MQLQAIRVGAVPRDGMDGRIREPLVLARLGPRHRAGKALEDLGFKEVIQPQVPLRLPCYDFVPVMDHTVVTVLPSRKRS